MRLLPPGSNLIFINEECWGLFDEDGLGFCFVGSDYFHYVGAGGEGGCGDGGGS